MPTRRNSNETNHRLVQCCLLNARRIVNKLNEFYFIIYSTFSSMYFITESWLSEDINTGLIDPLSKYTVIRKDRGTTRHGGVASLVSREFEVVTIDLDITFSDLEIIGFDVFCYGNCVRVFVVYRPPHYDSVAQHYIWTT